jgi:thiosulfate reductase cytochrome b subunit
MNRNRPFAFSPGHQYPIDQWVIGTRRIDEIAAWLLLSACLPFLLSILLAGRCLGFDG